MTRNEVYGFDQDFDISAIHVYCDAKEEKEKAEAKAAEEAAREAAYDEAVEILSQKIFKFFEYLGYHNTARRAAGENVWEYVNNDSAAKQIIRSMLKVGMVPKDLIVNTANSIIDNNDDPKIRVIMIRVKEILNYA